MGREHRRPKTHLGPRGASRLATWWCDEQTLALRPNTQIHLDQCHFIYSRLSPLLAAESITPPSLSITHLKMMRTSTRSLATIASSSLRPTIRPAFAPLKRAYHEKVIDHYENPRNVGNMPKLDQDVGTGLVGAPACGDVMKLQIRVDDHGESSLRPSSAR